MSTNIRMGEHRPPPAWRRYRRYWPVVLVVTGLVMMLAVSAALVRSPIYTAEARLAVGSGEMTALNIPGFPTASEEMASNYARWVTHQSAQGVGKPDGTLSVSASPIIESNVLRIEATSTDPETALRAAKETTASLMQAVNQVSAENDPEQLLAQIESTIAPLTTARRDNDAARERYDAALAGSASGALIDFRLAAYVNSQSTLMALELEQDGLRDRYRRLVGTSSTEAQLVEVSPAGVVGHDRNSVLQRNGLLGLIVGAGISWAAVAVLDRRRRTTEGVETAAPGPPGDEDADTGDSERLPDHDDDHTSGSADENATDHAVQRESDTVREDEYVGFVDARTG